MGGKPTSDYWWLLVITGDFEKVYLKEISGT
jgi:hypothetical protein